jgi:hypothetical protein
LLTIHVVASESGTTGRAVPVEEVPFVIGREGDCDLILEDPRVSRRHAQVEVLDDGRVVLRDLGSANGTFVDGTRIEGGTWFTVPGNFRVGRTVLRIETDHDQATMAIPADSLPRQSPAPAVPPPAPAEHPGGPVPAVVAPAAIDGDRPPGVKSAAWLLVAAGAIYVLGGVLLLIGVSAASEEVPFIPFGILAILNLVLGLAQLVLARLLSRRSQRVWLTVMGVAVVSAGLAAWDLLTALSLGLPPWFIIARLGLAVGIIARLRPLQDWFRAA